MTPFQCLTEALQCRGVCNW